MCVCVYGEVGGGVGSCSGECAKSVSMSLEQRERCGELWPPTSPITAKQPLSSCHADGMVELLLTHTHTHTCRDSTHICHCLNTLTSRNFLFDTIQNSSSFCSAIIEEMFSDC